MAKKLRLPEDIILRWVANFNWRERRARINFKLFQKLEEIRDRKKANFDQRHDRLASTLEGVIEDILVGHYNGKEKLAPKDLDSVARAIERMQRVRRTTIDEPTDKIEQTLRIEGGFEQTLVLDTTESFDNATEAIAQMIGVRRAKKSQIAIGDAVDAEFEIISDSQVKEHSKA